MPFFVGGGRSFSVTSRGTSMPADFKTIGRAESGESLLVWRGGITITIPKVGVQLGDGPATDLGTVSLSADRVVAYVPFLGDLFTGDATLSDADGELYLEGDIVFRQGDRIIYADRMYYNVRQEKGVVLDAEAILSVPEYEGIVRLKADVMQQLAADDFLAFNTAVTSSRMGVPRYWLQSNQLRLTERQRTVVDPQTGRPTIDRDPFASSQDSFVYFGGVPIFYWPRFATSLERSDVLRERRKPWQRPNLWDPGDGRL